MPHPKVRQITEELSLLNFKTYKNLMKKLNLLILLIVILTGFSSCNKDNPDDANTPIVTTNPITNITKTTATAGGNVIDDSGSFVTARGVCYSTSPNPTIADNITEGGTGTGAFTSNLSGLQPNSTTYYVRAYATNSNGTGYGDEIQFTTMAGNIDIIQMETVFVAGGTFLMGSDASDNEAENDEMPKHSVTISDFRISKYEITNQQYADFLNAINANSDGSVNGVTYIDMANNDCKIDHDGNNFVVYPGKENYPVIDVTWFGAKAYCEYHGGRLPTEAEWEFAARGGSNSNGYIYSGSNNIDDVAWYDANSNNPDNDILDGQGTHIVGTKNPNELGIYDMSGNVNEWCNDWYDSNIYNDYYNAGTVVDPQGPSQGQGIYDRVFRGGDWFHPDYTSRVANRSRAHPTDVGNNLGFRPVFAP